MSMPKVSIIMPSLNVRPYIVECLESVINQSLQEIEVLCVDAGSTDGTLDILQKYASHDNRIRIIHSDLRSYGYQMNLGLDKAQGSFIGVVETDDYIQPDMFETLYDRACLLEADIVKADYAYFFGNGDSRHFEYKDICPNESLYEKVLSPTRNRAVFTAGLYTWAGIYRTSFLKQFNIRHHQTPGASYQDNGFWFQCFTQAERIVFIRKPFYMLRRDNPNSSVKSTAKELCMCEEYDFIRDFLRLHPKLEAEYAPLCAKYRFLNYLTTANRISQERKLAFLRRFQQDFQWIEAHNELDRTLFDDNEWNTLQCILRDPDVYYARFYSPSISSTNESPNSSDIILKLKAAEDELEKLKSSSAFRVGRIIAWFPNTIRKACQYIRIFGFSGFFYRLLHHKHHS